MLRNVLVSTVLALGAITAANAQSAGWGLGDPATARTGPLDWGPTDYSYSPSAHGGAVPEQLLRWAEVGRCVVAKDREDSLSYVSVKARSAEATAAARRLRTAFGSCFWGSGVLANRNEAMRRAAVADALGVRLPS